MEGSKQSKSVARSVIEVPGCLKQLGVVRSFVRQFYLESVRNPIDWDFIYQVELAVNEAAANVIQHAYAGQQAGTIRVELSIQSGRLDIKILHNGRPFDSARVRPPVFDGSRNCGFGLFMIKQCMDDVQYFEDSGGNRCIRLTRSLGQDCAPPRRASRPASRRLLMDVVTERIGDIIVVTIGGDALDASNADELKQEVTQLIERTPKIIFDLRSIQFMDSAGLGVLLSSLRRATAANGDLKLCGLTSQVRGVLHMTRMNRIFDISEGRDEALQRFLV